MPIDKITTAYLQDYIRYLQMQGLKCGTVRLYFQKLACVLHDAYKNGLFDDRILQRVKRPKREQEKKSFLSETELKKLTKHQLSDEYNNIQTMFLFSCLTGLRFSDVQGLRWKDVKRNGKHLQLEFHQPKTQPHKLFPRKPSSPDKASSFPRVTVVTVLQCYSSKSSLWRMKNVQIDIQ